MNPMEKERRFQLSEALVDHLIEEMNTFCDTNDLIVSDMLYVINKIFTLTLLSLDNDEPTIKAVIDYFNEHTQKALEIKRLKIKKDEAS